MRQINGILTDFVALPSYLCKIVGISQRVPVAVSGRFSLLLFVDCSNPVVAPSDTHTKLTVQITHYYKHVNAVILSEKLSKVMRNSEG